MACTNAEQLDLTLSPATPLIPPSGWRGANVKYIDHGDLAVEAASRAPMDLASVASLAATSRRSNGDDAESPHMSLPRRRLLLAAANNVPLADGRRNVSPVAS